MKSLLPLVAALLLGALIWQGLRALRVASVAEELEGLEAGIADQDLEEALGRVLEPLAEDKTTDSQWQRLLALRDDLVRRLAGRDLLITRPDRADEAPMSLGVARAAPLTGRDSVSLDFSLREGSALASEAAALRVSVAGTECSPAKPGDPALFTLNKEDRRETLRITAHGSPWLSLGAAGTLALRADRVAPTLALRVQDRPVSPLRDGARIPITGNPEIEVSASDESALSLLTLQWRGEVEDISSAGAGFLDHRFTPELAIDEEAELVIDARDAAGNRKTIHLTLMRKPKILPDRVEVKVIGAIQTAKQSYVGGNQALSLQVPVRREQDDFEYRLQIGAEELEAPNDRGIFAIELGDLEHGAVLKMAILAVNDERRVAVWGWSAQVDKRGPEIQLEDEAGQPVVVFPDVEVIEGGMHHVHAEDKEAGQPSLTLEVNNDSIAAKKSEQAQVNRASYLLRFNSAGETKNTIIARAQDALGNEATPRTWSFRITAPAPKDDAQPPRIQLHAGDASVEEGPLVFRAGEVPALSISLSDPSGIDPQGLKCVGAEHKILESRPATHPTFLRLSLTPTASASGPIAITIVDLQGRSTKRIWDLTVVDAQAELSGEAIVDDHVVFGSEPRKFRVKLAQPPPADLLSARFVRQDEEEAPRPLATFEAFNGRIDQELNNAEGDWALEIVLAATDGEKVLRRLAVRR